MLLGISFYLLLFGTVTDNGTGIQLTAVILFLLYAVIITPNALIDSRTAGQIDGISFLLCFVVPIVSIAVLVIDANFSLIPQSLLFMACCFAAKHISSRKPLSELALIFMIASAIMAMTVLLFEYEQLNDSLNLLSIAGGGRIRFAPFGNHPNLTAHIFGTASIVSLVFCMNNYKSKTKLFYLAAFCGVFSVMYIFAASSRGSTLAMALSFVGLLLLRSMSRKSEKTKIVVGVILAVIIVVVLVQITGLSDNGYFSDLFELKSEYRGFDAGLTGRADNWPLILSMAFESISSIFFGNGIRSWDVDYYDMATDSFYVNQIWESGVFITIFIAYFILKKLYELINSTASFEADVAIALILFILIESVVARYLLGIGNPGSLFLLLVYLSKSNTLAVR